MKEDDNKIYCNIYLVSNLYLVKKAAKKKKVCMSIDNSDVKNLHS